MNHLAFCVSCVQECKSLEELAALGERLKNDGERYPDEWTEGGRKVLRRVYKERVKQLGRRTSENSNRNSGENG